MRASIFPYWTYAADTESQYTGARGVHYWETEYFTATDGNGNQVQQSRQVMRTAWSPASGAGGAELRRCAGPGDEVRQ